MSVCFSFIYLFVYFKAEEIGYSDSMTALLFEFRFLEDGGEGVLIMAFSHNPHK